MPDLEPIVQPINTNYNPAGMLSFIGHLGAIPGIAVLAAAGVMAVGGATVEAVKSTIAWGLSLDDVMDKIGGTSEEAAGLRVIADAVGMSVDDATRALNLMGKNLENVNGEMGTAGKALTELKIEFRNADGTFRSSMDIFKDVATTLTAMPDGLTKTRYEMEIFGRSGAAMNDMLRLAADGGMQKFINQAKAMGLALSENQIKNIERLSENVNVMKDQFTGFSVIIGSAFIPAVQAVVTWIGNMVTAVTPAIQHFGDFLGILLNVPGASGGAMATVAAVGGGAPTGYKELINYNFWANQPHPAGAVNPYAAPGGGGGGAISDRYRETGAMGRSGSVTGLSGFELSVKSFVDGIKQVNWTQVAKDFNAAGAAVKDAIKFADNLIHPTLGLKPGGDSATIFGELKDQQVKLVDGLGKKITDFFAPKFDDQWKKDADRTIAWIKAANDAKAATDRQNETNTKINTSLLNLPGQIKAAMAVGKK